MNKFTNLIKTINEQLPPAPDAGAEGGGAPPPADTPPPPAPPPAAQVDPGVQALEDVTLASKLALHGDFNITPEDRASLIQVIDANNIQSIRDILNSIVNSYDVPDV
jgi:hypothetical protein